MQQDLVCEDDFCNDVIRFLNNHFKCIDFTEHGEIETRTFNSAYPNRFFADYAEIADYLWQLKQAGVGAYFGVNPRVGRGGKKPNVKYAVTIHSDIDYGEEGHKNPDYPDRESAVAAIKAFPLEPSIIIDTGGGFHCYWLFDKPKHIADESVLDEIENVSRTFSKALGVGRTQDISRVFRVPYTDNWKTGTPRPTGICSSTDKRYTYQELLSFAKSLPAFAAVKAKLNNVTRLPVSNPQSPVPQIYIDNRRISDDVRRMIGGDWGWFSDDRSVCDMKIVGELVRACINREEIIDIFQSYPTSGKCADHPSPLAYLNTTIDKAIESTGLLEDEVSNPLFGAKVLYKKDDKVELDLFNMQTHLCTEKYFKRGVESGTYYYFDDTHYCSITDDRLNELCQHELSDYRRLFMPGGIKTVKHFLAGADIKIDDTVDVNLIGFENGIFDIQDKTLKAFSHELFVRNILPFKYDVTAQCTRYLTFLDEVFMSNQEQVTLVQEIIGYTFHKEMPIDAMFLLHGTGANGKSVFLNIIECLHGKENTANVSLSKLNDDNYLVHLMGKTINVSSESSVTRKFQSDVVKQVTAGDRISARSVYKDVVTFCPYAKHFFAVNKMPELLDNSYGMMRRLYVIGFPVQFTNGDPYLTAKLQQELPGIFNWALEGYRRLQANKFVFSCSNAMREQMNAKYYEDNETAEFVAATLTKSNDDSDRVPWKEYYELYKNRMELNKVRNYLKKSELKTFLIGQGFVINNSNKHGNQVMVFYARLIN